MVQQKWSGKLGNAGPELLQCPKDLPADLDLHAPYGHSTAHPPSLHSSNLTHICTHSSVTGERLSRKRNNKYLVNKKVLIVGSNTRTQRRKSG